MEQLFAIGDVHGEYDLFQNIVDYVDLSQQQLLLIGDLNDRGPKSKDCWLLGKKLVDEHQAIYLRGNHEEYFLQFLNDPEDWYASYFYNGGKETIESLLHPGATEEYSPTEIAMFIRSRYKELIHFLLERPLYYEWKHYLFVHAGVDLQKKDWRQTTDRDFLWIREPFHHGENHTDKTIVFGHTITPMLYGDMQTTALWQQDRKIGIDGGAVFGGSLHGVVFDEQGIVKDYELPNRNGPWNPTI
ncbi:serine/threonine protein phosphatase [Enterococcus florum]|uniref:Serine/threonine protein phosphatase n=1 Tax=Enterococcus florum TaxID=2480627 RepID=A0A4P5PMR2_9ENTE|nr:metallophosphoesterase family protein [Enterococcus florum]GCF94513.1 serine/threonine protein phosphatase [Enterococcus florum]